MGLECSYSEWICLVSIDESNERVLWEWGR